MSIEYPCVYWSDGMCKKFSDDKVTSFCVEGPCGDQMQSNADRIRAMSDEELAAWMSECNAYREYAIASQWLPWLQQPAEDGER